MATTSQFTADANTIALWHFDGALGSTAKKADAKGSNNIATETNVTSVTGWDGTTNGAYNCAATNGTDYFKTAAQTPTWTTAFSWEFWINFGGNTPSIGHVITFPATDGTWVNPYGSLLRWNSATSVDVAIQTGPSSGNFTEPVWTGLPNIIDSNWHYIAFTFDSAINKARLYFDGSQVGGDKTTSGTLYSHSAPLYFLGYAPAGTGIKASLDEFRISNIARSASEISSYYAGATPATVTPSVIADTGSIATPNVSTWYNSSWLHRKAITINHTKVPADQTNMPVNVDLSGLGSDFFANVKSDGGDIRMTTSDGITEVPVEVVSINTGSSTGVLHFKAPSLSSSVDTIFYIYYGNASASLYAVTATYGRNNVWSNGYAGVYHLEADGMDSTGAHNGTLIGAPQNRSFAGGKVGDGISLEAGGQAGVQIMAPTAAFTWQCWLNSSTASSSSYQTALAVGNTNYVLFDVQGGAMSFWSVDGLGGSNLGATPISNSTWYMVHLTRSGDSATNGYTAFVNGAQKSQANTGTYSSTDPIQIGTRQNLTGQDFNGVLDEVRISTVARSASWVATEYNNQNSPSTFYSVGSQETGSSAASVSPSTATGTETVPSPSITAKKKANPTPAVDTGSHTIPSPTVTAKQKATISPAAVTGSHTVPASSEEADTAVLPSPVTGSGTALPPSITAKQTASPSPSVETGTGTVPAASVETAVALSPSTITGAGTEPAPSITAEQKANATPSVVTGTGTIPAPSIHTGVDAEPNAESGSGTIVTPSLSIPIDAAPSTLAGTGTTPSPVVQADVDVLPAAEYGTGTVEAPTVSSPSGINPSPVTGTGSVPSVAVQAGETDTPSVVTGSGTVENPSIAAGSTVEAPEATGSGTTPVPVISAGATETATAVAGTGTIAAPSLETAVTIVPSAVSGSGTIAAPSIATESGSNATPQPVSGSGATLAPSVEADETSKPNAISGQSVIEQPAVESGVEITLVSLTGIGTVPVVQIDVPATVTASSINAEGILVQPTIEAGDTISATEPTGTGSIPSPSVHLKESECRIIYSSSIALDDVVTVTSVAIADIAYNMSVAISDAGVYVVYAADRGSTHQTITDTRSRNVAL